MNWPKISVIIPSYNQAQFIEETLNSVICQNYPNLELIAIDGNSDDGSVDILRKYEKYLTYWVSEPDGGQTRGLIKGFARSTGEIQCWLNSDDLQEPRTLWEVADYLASHPSVDAVFGDAVWIDRRSHVLRAQREIPFNRFIWMHTYNYIPGMSMFWRSSLYKKVGGLDPSYHLAMDADLWSRFAEVGRIAHVRRIWSRMRYYPEQKNIKLRAISDVEDMQIRRRYWGMEHPPFYAARRMAAQLMRILWKLSTGCYSWNYRRYMVAAK